MSRQVVTIKPIEGEPLPGSVFNRCSECGTVPMRVVPVLGWAEYWNGIPVRAFTHRDVLHYRRETCGHRISIGEWRIDAT